MDQERFDRIARSLATGTSRRGVLKGLTGTALGGILTAVGIGGTVAKGGKVSFCHRNGDGTYDYITVAQSAVATHRKHGDAENPNLTIDASNCGTCGNVCEAVDACTPVSCSGGACNQTSSCTAAPDNATPTCGQSGCSFTCDAGYELNEAGDGCEAVGCIPDDMGGVCPVTLSDPGPPARVELTFQDTASGIASLLVTLSENADTVVPPFDMGTTEPIVVGSTKIDQTKQSCVGITYTLGDGTVRTCGTAF